MKYPIIPPVVINSPPALTLQEVIKKRIKELGLTRLELVTAIGYTNTNKGLRRFHDFLEDMQAPNDNFIKGLLSALTIDGVTYSRALQASLDEMNAKADAEAKSQFHPHIEILINFSPQSFFGYIIVHRECKKSVPEDLQHLKFNEEVAGIVAIYENYIKTLSFRNFTVGMPSYRKHTPQENIDFHKQIIGFRYHRHHNYYLEFDTGLTLIEIGSIKTTKIKEGLGNRLINLLNGQQGGMTI